MAACGMLHASACYQNHRGPSSAGEAACRPAAVPLRRCGMQTQCRSSAVVTSRQHLGQQSIGFQRLGDLHRMRHLECAAGPSATLPIIDTEEEFNAVVHEHDLVIVDFMARWCRKCIYLKPKLERMLREDFPGLPVLFVDVNAVPSALIKTAGVRKMPTIQLYKNGELECEHIAAEGAIDALEKIKVMILDHTDLQLPTAA